MLATVLDAPLTLRWRTRDDRAFFELLAKQALGEYSLNASVDTVSMTEHLPTLVAVRGEALGGLRSIQQVDGNAAPVGFAVVEIEPRGAHLQAIAVAERERGRGVGRALVRAAENFARSRGARSFSLHTAQANVAGLSLFLAAGFQIEARLPRYYRGVYDACRMKKSL